MAILLTDSDGNYETVCAICELPLTEPIFATTHFISDESDRLYPYSDAGMHWECYATWKYQRRFAKQYFESALQWKLKNRFWPLVASTDDFLLTANPILFEPEADLDIKAIGPGFRIPISDWRNWINGGWDTYCVHDLQRQAIVEIEQQLRMIVPDSNRLMELGRVDIHPRVINDARLRNPR